MSTLNAILDFIKKKKSEPDTATVPAGFCPNCWGRQEYEGHFFEAMKNEGVDIKEIKEKSGWIQAYAAERLQSIQLKEVDGSLVCASCKVTYKPAA